LCEREVEECNYRRVRRERATDLGQFQPKLAEEERKIENECEQEKRVDTRESSDPERPRADFFRWVRGIVVGQDKS
jgi:hypothetical protein